MNTKQRLQELAGIKFKKDYPQISNLFDKWFIEMDEKEKLDEVVETKTNYNKQRILKYIEWLIEDDLVLSGDEIYLKIKLENEFDETYSITYEEFKRPQNLNETFNVNSRMQEIIKELGGRNLQELEDLIRIVMQDVGNRDTIDAYGDPIKITTSDVYKYITNFITNNFTV